MLDIDFKILDFIRENLNSSFGDFIMPLISALGNGGAIWIILNVVLLIMPKTRKYGFVMAMSLLLNLLVCNIILKPVIARTRPFILNPEIELLVSPPHDYSFPSGHTAASFAATSSLCFSRKKLCISALVLSVLIAFSRLYLYVHFPTDVLAGVILGIASGYVSNKIIYKYRNNGA